MSRMKKAMVYFFLLLSGIALVFVLFVFAVSKGVFGHVPGVEELKVIRNETASLVYSEDKKLIGKFFAENRTNTSYEQLPESLIHALIAVEDARYFEHKGIDSRSLVRVFFKTLLLQNKRAGGGSTISQQ